MSAKTNNTPRQHGAMEHTDAPCNLDTVRHYRLARVRQVLASRDLAGIVLYDQVNTRYALRFRQDQRHLAAAEALASLHD